MPFSPAENIGKIPYFADVILPATKVLRAHVFSDVGDDINGILLFI